MNKSELIEQVADRADIKRSEAEAAVNALTEVVKETLQRGGDVAITGFGKFSVAERGARQGVNPQTGERIQIAVQCLLERPPDCVTLGELGAGDPRRRALQLLRRRPARLRHRRNPAVADDATGRAGV